MVNSFHYEVSLTDDDLDTLTKALWDLAALQSGSPRAHTKRLHLLRRYLLAIQVSRASEHTWPAPSPARPSEST
jgi:hypothetical protein